MALRVAVIGAGAGGLAALRHLLARPDVFTPMAFEQTGTVGGTWVYTDRVGLDDHGLPIHASMYKNLRTNLPKEVMAFPDFPFSSKLPSFMTHQEVYKYLEDYAEHYKLNTHIQFNTVVDHVTPVPQADRMTWDVETRDITRPDASVTNRQFDAVIVCNGHYSIPLIPDLPGMDQFQGTVIHSHDYRTPDVFADQTVAVLGGGASGVDMSMELCKHAKMVYLCHRKPRYTSPIPDNLRQAPGIKQVKANSVIMDDDTEIHIDSLLVCTGYRFTFPFLSKNCHLTVQDQRIYPLYKHVIHAEYPTLSFIGMCKIVCPFPQFHCQVLFALAALTGDMKLPSQADMEADIEVDYQWRLSQGYPHRYAHTMGPLQWAYNDMLADMAGVKRIDPVVNRLYDYVHETRIKRLPTYKTLNYELVNSEEFREV